MPFSWERTAKKAAPALPAAARRSAQRSTIFIPRTAPAVSKDAEHWELLTDIMNCGDEDQQKIGFQYVDFFIENGRIYYLCRTAMNGADTFHNSNYSTFGTYTV